ncbi:MAG: tRNA 2-thiouridine(34) synthase MnmA [Aquificota bacterium]|nr:MAG: tRNA 2-thiouridine(34) synthase MnmA [Aquificota bacterium]
MGKRVAVGLSGGVDSSVSALLLKEKGYDVVGITLKLSSIECSTDIQVCCSTEDIKDAKRVASFLGIEHYVVDWEEVFKEKVIKAFVEELKRGKTPNPCSICNRDVKTGLLTKYVRTVLGADFLATGHYIRKIKKQDRELITRGVDIKKDQSYFMALVEKEIIPFLLFPLGELTKEETRKLAEKYKIPVSQKKDSFEICFTAGKTPGEYIYENRIFPIEEGDILHISGKVLGKHKGLPFYTIGQRKGLGIRWKEPLYVLEKLPEQNAIVVGEKENLYTDRVSVKSFNFHLEPEKWDIKNLYVQGRYKQKPVKIKDVDIEKNKITFVFEEKQPRFAPGQILAVYESGNVLLGGGIIT